MKITLYSLCIFSFLIILSSCKKDKEEEVKDEDPVKLVTKCYPTDVEIEKDGESQSISMEFNSDGLLEKIKAFENDKYELEYGFYKKLESITYHWDGEPTFLDRFYYNSDGILVEIHTYSYYDNKNIFNSRHNSVFLENLRRATLETKGREKFLDNNGEWVLSMMHKFWLNEDVLPDKIEDVSSINEKMSEIEYSYDSDGNVKKEKYYQMNMGTGELELRHEIKNDFDDKKSPGSDLKNVFRFTLLSELIPLIKHSINNVKESSFENVEQEETVEYSFKNKYNDDDYLVSCTKDDGKVEEKTSYDFDCKEEKVEE